MNTLQGGRRSRPELVDVRPPFYPLNRACVWSLAPWSTLGVFYASDGASLGWSQVRQGGVRTWRSRSSGSRSRCAGWRRAHWQPRRGIAWRVRGENAASSECTHTRRTAVPTPTRRLDAGKRRRVQEFEAETTPAFEMGRVRSASWLLKGGQHWAYLSRCTGR